jgi:TRAP-type C4-dicarboxylate transport system substrate-binding protein
MKMKKICALLLCMAMLLSLAACGDSATTTDPNESLETITISIATPTADGNPMQELVYYFEEQVDTLLPGRVEWQNYPNSAMGSERELGEQVIDGTLNAALVGPTNIPAFAPMDAVRLQDVPFLFRTQDELYAASDEWYADMINEECEKYGITTVFYEYIMGQEIENTKRPINTPEDVKNLKILKNSSLRFTWTL